MSEALNKLREQTKEAVKGLESISPPTADDLGKDALMEDWVKQFEQLAGSQVFPFVLFLCLFPYVLVHINTFDAFSVFFKCVHEVNIYSFDAHKHQHYLHTW